MMSTLCQSPNTSTAIADLGSSDCRRLVAHTRADALAISEQFCTELYAAGFTNNDILAIRLALEEALVNGIHHGNRDDPNKQVDVRYSIHPDRVVLMIEDEGPGFNPDIVPDPRARENAHRLCGRGVFLMRNYMTWVRFNERGNRVTMCKRKT
jgi:serine/threonine-protein kinase RsbW